MPETKCYQLNIANCHFSSITSSYYAQSGCGGTVGKQTLTLSRNRVVPVVDSSCSLLVSTTRWKRANIQSHAQFISFTDKLLSPHFFTLSTLEVTNRHDQSNAEHQATLEDLCVRVCLYRFHIKQKSIPGAPGAQTGRSNVVGKKKINVWRTGGEQIRRRVCVSLGRMNKPKKENNRLIFYRAALVQPLPVWAV